MIKKLSHISGKSHRNGHVFSVDMKGWINRYFISL